MIGCLALTDDNAALLRTLRLQLQQHSARVAYRTGEAEAQLLIDLGRGRQADAAHWLAQLTPPAASAGARLAIAPTVTTALLALRHTCAAAPLLITPLTQRALFAACPLDWLPACLPHLPVLHGLGIRHLADLADLPAAALTARFDGALLTQWRALHGDEPPFRPLAPPPHLRVRRRMNGTVSDGLLLAAVLQGVALRLGRLLEHRGLQARSVLLEVSGDGYWAASRVLEQPACGPLLAQQVAGLLSAAAVDAGVDCIALQAAELLAIQPEQLSLLAAPTDRQTSQAVLADLAARCGDEVFLRVQALPNGLQPSEQQLVARAWSMR